MLDKQKAKEYKEAHRAEHREYQRRYYKKHHKKVLESERLRRATPENQIRVRKWQKEHYVPHPKIRNYSISEGELLKKRVRAETRRAIKRGELVRLCCEKCSKIKSEAHHPDYSKPLDVRWFCRTHHVEHHKEIGSYTKRHQELSPRR